jgi:DNA-directed RNA polymerase specialized sigma24 family protein
MASGQMTSGHTSPGREASGSPASDPTASSDLATLYLHQREAMVRLARLLTGSMVVAEEIVQEAFLRLGTVKSSLHRGLAKLRDELT